MATEPLVLYWNEELKDHLTSAKVGEELAGYVRVGTVGNVMRGAGGLGNGVMLNDGAICREGRVISEEERVPENWEICFDLVPRTKMEGGEVMGWVKDGKKVFSVGMDPGNQRIVIKTTNAQLRSTKIVPLNLATHVTIRMVNNNMKLYLNKEEDCWIHEGKYLGNLTVAIHCCTASTTPADCIVGKLTLSHAKAISPWESRRQIEIRDGASFVLPPNTIEALVCASYGSGSDWVDVTPIVKKKISSNGGINLTVCSKLFRQESSKTSRQLVVSMIPKRKTLPSKQSAGHHVVALYQLWNEEARNHLLTSDPDPFLKKGYVIKHLEGFAYHSLSPDMLLTCIETYTSTETGDTCAVVDLPTLKRIRQLRGYVRTSPGEGCILP
eukprot:TRINITY_DN18348_c1_g1_i1.p1 TRINITY_DN18348_c1_g1~~TRINITY_DN18348_c1_g1_i1.p1  ORF type:complete len:383 (+),score=107.15 TRINITY_DN18348_c1_g1_i1:57-1205(+)